jgi:hypothetical protein
MGIIVDGGRIWVTISKILYAEPAGSLPSAIDIVATDVARCAACDKTDVRSDTSPIGGGGHALQRYPSPNPGRHDGRQ